MSQHDDLSKLITDYGNQCINDAENLYYNGTHDLECPHCGVTNDISFNEGKSVCPSCNEGIILPRL